MNRSLEALRSRKELRVTNSCREEVRKEGKRVVRDRNRL